MTGSWNPIAAVVGGGHPTGRRTVGTAIFSVFVLLDAHSRRQPFVSGLTLDTDRGRQWTSRCPPRTKFAPPIGVVCITIKSLAGIIVIVLHLACRHRVTRA